MQRAAVQQLPSEQSPESSLVAGRYRLEAKLARGGMGQVFRARDVSSGEPVALKRLVGTALAAARALVIVVDNLEAADDASAALLAALAADAGDKRLLVLAALRDDDDQEPTAGVRFVAEHVPALALRPLDADQTVALARAMFGPVPNVMRLGEWMHRASGGIVSHCFELATELNRSSAARYAGGTWVLPDEAEVGQLPVGMADALQRRLARLSPPALQMAQALSVHDSPLDVTTCRAVAEAAGVVEPFAALDDLVDHGVLVTAGDRYRFSQDGLRALLL